MFPELEKLKKQALDYLAKHPETTSKMLEKCLTNAKTKEEDIILDMNTITEELKNDLDFLDDLIDQTLYDLQETGDRTLDDYIYQETMNYCTEGLALLRENLTDYELMNGAIRVIVEQLETLKALSGVLTQSEATDKGLALIFYNVFCHKLNNLYQDLKKIIERSAS